MGSQFAPSVRPKMWRILNLGKRGREFLHSRFSPLHIPRDPSSNFALEEDFAYYGLRFPAKPYRGLTKLPTALARRPVKFLIHKGLSFRQAS
jgi:hypothetical protein